MAPRLSVRLSSPICYAVGWATVACRCTLTSLYVRKCLWCVTGMANLLAVGGRASVSRRAGQACDWVRTVRPCDHRSISIRGHAAGAQPTSEARERMISTRPMRDPTRDLMSYQKRLMSRLVGPDVRACLSACPEPAGTETHTSSRPHLRSVGGGARRRRFRPPAFIRGGWCEL